MDTEHSLPGITAGRRWLQHEPRDHCKNTYLTNLDSSNLDDRSATKLHDHQVATY
jgi:hypothetical protein